MRGSTQVTVEQVTKALEAYSEHFDKSKLVFQRALTDFANLKKSTWFGKWKAGNKSDREVAASYLGGFQTWDDILHEVVSKEDLKLISDYTWGSWAEQHQALKSLKEVSDTGFVQVDKSLARFLIRFSPKTQ